MGGVRASPSPCGRGGARAKPRHSNVGGRMATRRKNRLGHVRITRLLRWTRDDEPLPPADLVPRPPRAEGRGMQYGAGVLMVQICEAPPGRGIFQASYLPKPSSASPHGVEVILGARGTGLAYSVIYHGSIITGDDRDVDRNNFFFILSPTPIFPFPLSDSPDGNNFGKIG